MLNRRENEVMRAVYTLCEKQGICLISPAELIERLPTRKKYDEAMVEKILNALALDDYFQLLFSERKGEKMYVISLHAGGYAYKRCQLQQKRNTLVKIAWAITSAVIAFAVGWILKKIF
jgi:hypothetical protein